MYSAIIAFSPRKSKDLKCIEKTLKILLKYHAVKPDNEHFCSRYRHLIGLYHMLCNKEGITKCLM